MALFFWRMIGMVLLMAGLAGCGARESPRAQATATRAEVVSEGAPTAAAQSTPVESEGAPTATAPSTPVESEGAPTAAAQRTPSVEGERAPSPSAPVPGEASATVAAATATEAPAVPTAAPTATAETALAQPVVQEYQVPAGTHPHDVAPAPDGTVWYTAQAVGALGRLDPATGESHHIPLGPGSAPHGVIVGPDGAPWITDGGLNAIVRVDPEGEAVEHFPLPPEARGANLNTATFDGRGVLWFTGQTGWYGRLDPTTKEMEVFQAPRGRGPYGITTTPGGEVYYASLAGDHIAKVDLETGAATVIEPPTPNQGARRVWSDGQGRIWVSEWDAGQVAVYDPASEGWQEWRLPGNQPRAYAVYVDDQGMVWLSDFGSNSLVRFDPETETFEPFPLPSSPANVRQILGRPGEVWGAESGTDKLVVIRTR